MTRPSRGDSLSQRLELGGYEPSAHGRRAGYKFWIARLRTVIMDVGEMGELACMLILISRSCRPCDAVNADNLRKLGQWRVGVAGACVWLVRCGDPQPLQPWDTRPSRVIPSHTSKHNHRDGYERTAYCALLSLAN
jgi:hypothetical protein